MQSLELRPARTYETSARHAALGLTRRGLLHGARPMFHEMLFEALTRAGTLQRALEDAARFAERENRLDDRNLYRNVRNQITDALANR